MACTAHAALTVSAHHVLQAVLRSHVEGMAAAASPRQPAALVAVGHFGSSTITVLACLLPKLVGGSGGLSSACHFSVCCNLWVAPCQLLAWQVFVMAAEYTHSVLAVTPHLSMQLSKQDTTHNMNSAMHAVPSLVLQQFVWAHELIILPGLLCLLVTSLVTA